MTAELRDPIDDTPSRLAPGYMADSASRPLRLQRTLILAGVVGFCLFYGMAFAFFAPYLLLLFAIPLALLALLVIWALPAARRAPTNLLTTLFFGYIVVLVMWPNYLALALPGLPWITASRLLGLPAFGVFLVCVSTSPQVVASITAAMNNLRPLSILLIVFVAIQTVSVVFSDQKPSSVDRLIIAYTSWTAMLLMACYIFQTPGRLERWATYLWVMGILVGAIAIWEFHHKQLPWVGHIPSFLKIDDPGVRKQMMGVTRAWTDIYRAQSTFGTSLDFGEYLSWTLPFVYHFLGKAYKWWVRALALASVPYLAYLCYCSGARIALIGFLLSTALSLLFWGIQRWRRNRKDLLGPAVVFAYPAGFVGLLGLIVAVGRIRAMFVGRNGAEKDSTRARFEQVSLGIPKILSHPWGYGIGRAGQTLNWRTPDGTMSIDNYYLLTILDYGVVGFLVFWSMIVYTIFVAFQYTLKYDTEDRELSMIVPVAICLVNFCAVRVFYSNFGNIPIQYMFIGIVFALCLRFERKFAPADETRDSVPTLGRNRPVGPRPAAAARG